MRRIITLVFLVFSLCSFAQVTNVQDTLFPKISFEWSEYSTEQRTSGDFFIIENDQNVLFEMTELRNPKTKTVLFLWEDLASHSGQYKAFKQILTSFFGADRENDGKFNVAVFNRRPFNAKSDGNSWLLLSDNFLSRQEIVDKISAYTSSAVHYPQENHAADLYASVENALKYIGEYNNGDKMIVLMTAGLNVSLSGATKERASLEDEARKANIPIYVVYYPYSGNIQVPSNIIGIAENTHGKVISAANVIEAANKLNEFYNQLHSRLYRFSFTSNQKRDGKPHYITLQNPTGQNDRVRYNAPNMTFRVWVNENLRLFIAIVVTSATALGIVIWLIARKSTKRHRKLVGENKENQRQIAQLKEKQELEKQERMDSERNRIEKENRKRQEEEEKSLNLLMQAKNLFPRLQCKVDDDSFTYHITKPHTTIGRNGFNNDLTFDNTTVSKQHAEIIFTGTGFEVIDKESTNKVIVNGIFVQRSVLKDGDIIGLGEIIITFYM